MKGLKGLLSQIILTSLLLGISGPVLPVNESNISTGLEETTETDIEKGILYWQKELFSSEDPSEYSGTPVEILGFIYRHEDDPKEIFFVGRLLLSCCYEDAFPQGLPVLLEDNEEWKNDQWILVKGNWDRQKFGDAERNVIIPETIESVEPPDDPYIYTE